MHKAVIRLPQLAHLLPYTQQHVRIPKAHVSVQRTRQLDGLPVSGVGSGEVSNCSVALGQVATDKRLQPRHPLSGGTAEAHPGRALAKLETHQLWRQLGRLLEVLNRLAIVSERDAALCAVAVAGRVRWVGEDRQRELPSRLLWVPLLQC